MSTEKKMLQDKAVSLEKPVRAPKIKARSRSFGEIRRHRAQHRWSRVHLHVQSAAATFSAAGQVRRQAFVQRKWHTVSGMDPPDPQKLTIPMLCLTEQSSSLEVGPPSPSKWSRQTTQSSTRSREKSVSFEEHPQRHHYSYNTTQSR